MLLPFDELNNLRTEIEGTAYEENGVRKYNRDDCIDLVLDALILAYIYGTDYANETLGTAIPPNSTAMQEAIYKKIAEKDFAERVAEYAEQGDIESIMRVADTEMTRDFNSGVLDTGKTGGAKYKTWVTMRDDRVRDPHWVLDSVKVGINDRFYTYGDSALQPGGFTRPELNCNCRCILKVTTD